MERGDVVNRRSFLGLLGLGAAGLVLDPERALWIPGQKRIFDLGAGHRIDDILVESGRLRGPNSILTINIVTQEALRVLQTNLEFTSRINQLYDDELWYRRAANGAVVPARIPARIASMVDRLKAETPIVVTRVPSADDYLVKL